MTTIIPTVGRVVWFWPNNLKSFDASFVYPRPESPCAAIIAHVWHPGLVNLQVIDQNGVSHSATSVYLVQAHEPKPDGNFCEWMPYQVGQAKKEQAT